MTPRRSSLYWIVPVVVALLWAAFLAVRGCEPDRSVAPGHEGGAK